MTCKHENLKKIEQRYQNLFDRLFKPEEEEMKYLYLLIEMQGGLIEDVIVYDSKAEAERNFRSRKREIKKGESGLDSMGLYRITPQLQVDFIDYSDQETG